DGIDNDCDDSIDGFFDRDDDGFFASYCDGENDPGEDCDDDDDRQYPGAPEICNEDDTDCDGEVDSQEDRDGDGRRWDCSDKPADCDDTNPDRYVGNEEVCETDGPPVDNSCFQVCDPSVHDCREELPRDITPNLLDWDGDGVFFDVCNPNSPDNDCNDNDFHVNPQALGDFCSDKDADCDGLKGEDYQPFDICGNGFDDDCDGKEDEGEPGLVDQCDTIDNNCVDGVDEAMDFDQDGSIHACCKDENPDDGVDDCPQGPTTYVGGTDCVDVKFNGDEPAWVRGDGRGECPNDWSAELCNLSKFIHPGQTEVCNGFDDNCNGEADEERDVDGDGELGFSCDPNKPVTDPDDTSAVCNVAPQSEDEFYEYAQYYDANGDGEPDCRTNCFNENGDDICQLDEICPMKPWEVAKGSPGSLTLYSLRNYFPTRQCAENSYTTSADENVFFEIPKTIEVSKGRCVEQWADLEFTNSQQTIRCRYNCDSDQNQYAFAWCDNGFSQNGDVVLADVVTLDNSLGDIFDAPLETRSMMIFEMRDCDPDALDKDGDLHFPPGSCYYPADDCDNDPETGGAFTDNCSCEDYAVASRPVREEVCDGHDNDCDGEIDNGVAAVYYVDRDRDGLGDDSHCFATCPFNINDAQFATVGGDCNDNADGARCSSECSDFDGDGYSSNCTEGPLDCDDSRADVFPGAPEVCDGADNDCDCRVDEDTIESQTECLAGSGPCAVAGTSICRNGALICREEAVSDYVAPMREICGDGVDNNCEGGVDEGCARADCTAGVHVAYASSACLPDSYAEAPAGLTTQGAPDPIPDSFAVNDHGAATYTLPIVVPPGIRGLQPSLSVSFNSQLRSGRRSPLGQGFTLTGVPSIERCAYQEVVDGWTSAPELNDEDAWCLGGQRLIRGDNPSTLYLHRSPFEPVEQTAWGFVWSKKDGTEWTFNNRVDVEGQTVRYRLTQVEDSYGNSISFQSYEHRLPSLIRYSGFTVSLEFEDYPSEGPPDGYFLGDRFARRRLARINVEADASGRIRSYVFEHDGQGTLQKITEEVGPSGASSTNTRSVTFDWDRWAGTDPQFTEVPRECSTCGVPAPPGGGRITIADLDGDGIPEVGPGFEIDGDDDVRLRYAKLTLDGEIIRRVDPWRNELPKDAEPHPPGCGSDDWRCQDWDDYLIEWWFDSDQDGTAEWWIGERERDHFYIFHPDLNDTACPSGSPDAPGCKGVREVSWRWRDFTRTWMGDFDGDSVFEIITANEHGDLRTINPALNLNSGSVRALEGGIKLGEGASPTSGDFDRDGVVDVRFMSGHNVWSFTGADRKTSSREVSTYPNANERTRLVSGDYN
ncbi:MAG: MopE-related protein, partial [Myxococcota bacterium]